MSTHDSWKRARGKKSLLTVQIVSCHQQLQAQLGRDVHVGDILRVAVAVVVVEILGDFLEDHAAGCPRTFVSSRATLYRLNSWVRAHRKCVSDQVHGLHPVPPSCSRGVCLHGVSLWSSRSSMPSNQATKRGGTYLISSK